MAEQRKRAVGSSATGQNRNTIAIGTNRRSQLSDGFNFTMNTGGIADTKFGAGHLRVLFEETSPANR